MPLRLLATVIFLYAVAAISPLAAAAEKAKGAGLSKAEATVIANRFFRDEIAMEAVVGDPSSQGDNWVFPLKVGYANNVARDPILVNRFTGQASWAGLDELNARRGRTNKAPPK